MAPAVSLKIDKTSCLHLYLNDLRGLIACYIKREKPFENIIQEERVLSYPIIPFLKGKEPCILIQFNVATIQLYDKK